ncbi:hypothetical protein BDY19DRAFT_988302 [Irpex rosettiformis]|uniref:Uncharacterized protein n=1 Tax=Irpex rosettiformis TaxID=378272 RepID=A0ACB8UJE8_9APHY|nr:hypothetical protein BDY19DRAFT_988302 [Irpex rosettiformis]
MPLRYTEDPATVETVKTASEKYLIFYSSRGENGKLWCPVCFMITFIARYRRKEILSSDSSFGPDCMGGTTGRVSAIQPPSNGSLTSKGLSRACLVVSIDDGVNPRWKSPSNVFRSEPWTVESIPTIIRVEDGARLVLDEIRDGIAPF